jgi:riboflavin synthase
MFTGIVGELGRLTGTSAESGGRTLCIAAAPSFLEGARAGESIAVNGVCQTVSRLGADSFSVFASGETLSCTNLKNLTHGMRLHLERALPLGGRFDGHIVTGHVDGTARVAAIEKSAHTLRVTVALPEDFLPLVAKKGSLAVDGVSLTVQDILHDRAVFVIIPESVRRTTLGGWVAGYEANVELDILARYVARSLETSVLARQCASHRAEPLAAYPFQGDRARPQASLLGEIMTEQGYAPDIRRED